MDDPKKRAMAAVDWALKMRTMMLLPDEFLAYVASVEANPTETAVSNLEQWCLSVGRHLEWRVAEYHRRTNEPRQPVSQPEFIPNSRLVN